MTAGEAIGTVETATEQWFGVADALEEAVDRAVTGLVVEDMDDRADIESELRACQSALMLLHLAVLNEIALVQPLEAVREDVRLSDLPGWPQAEVAHLVDVAFGESGARGIGLVALLSAGTDDGSESDDGSEPEPPDPEPAPRAPAAKAEFETSGEDVVAEGT
jgi:hypothetical protein